MPYAPTDFPNMLKAVRDWLVGQIGVSGKLASLMTASYSVIWAAQDAPYPGYPYATLRVTEPPRGLGDAATNERALADDGSGGTVERNEYDANLVIRVELLSKTGLDPNSGMDETVLLANALEASLRTGAVLEAFSVAGIPFIDNRSPLSIPVVAGYGFERRTQLDLMMRIRVRVDVTAQLVDPPDVTGTVDFQGHVTGSVQGS